MTDELQEKTRALLALDPTQTAVLPTAEVLCLVQELRHAMQGLILAADESRLLLNRTFTALTEAVFVVDPRSRVVIDCNPAVECVFGFRPDEVIGRNTEFLHVSREAYEDFGRELFPALDAAGVFRSRFEMKRQDGRIFVSDHTVTEIRDEHGERVGVVSVVRDVTALHRAEAALRESEERHRSLVSCSIDAVLLTAPDGRILSANEAACSMFGRTEEELTRLGRACVCDPSDPQVARVLQERARTGRFRGEIRLVRADGTTFPCEISSVVFANGCGEQRTSMVIRDISDRIAAHEALRREEAKLAQVERVARMSELASSIAHELNQPLTGILSSAQAARRLLAAARPELGEVRSSLDDIVEDSRRAAGFIGSLREMIRSGRPKRRPADINQVVHDAVRLGRHGPGHEERPVHTRLGRALPRVLVDPVQIQHVLLNLLDNAMQASAARPRGDPDVTISTRFHDGLGVVVAVNDRGPGIPVDDLERMFEPFHSTKPDGLGWGLAISRSLVEAQGGRIWAENRRGGGARFCFVVPASEGAER